MRHLTGGKTYQWTRRGSGHRDVGDSPKARRTTQLAGMDRRPKPVGLAPRGTRVGIRPYFQGRAIPAEPLPHSAGIWSGRVPSPGRGRWSVPPATHNHRTQSVVDAGRSWLLGYPEKWVSSSASHQHARAMPVKVLAAIGHTWAAPVPRAQGRLGTTRSIINSCRPYPALYPVSSRSGLPRH